MDKATENKYHRIFYNFYMDATTVDRTTGSSLYPTNRVFNMLGPSRTLVLYLLSRPGSPGFLDNRARTAGSAVSPTASADE